MLVDGDVDQAPGDEREPKLRVVADRGVRRRTGGGDAVGPPGHRRAPPNADDFDAPRGCRHDDAMIMFTGGTTGVPKMVPWTHGNIAGSVRAIIAGYRLGPQDATVAVMPLYHGHGLIAALLSTLASGGTVLLPARGRFSAHTFWDDIDAVGATWYTAVPTIHQILLERNKTDAAGQRAGRAALHPQLQRAAHPGDGPGAARRRSRRRWCAPSA